MLTQEELRIKRWRKTLKRRKKLEGKRRHLLQMQAVAKRRAAWHEATKDLRYWRQHWHLHKWEKLVKGHEGKIVAIGKICNKCGKTKMAKNWSMFFKTLLRFLRQRLFFWEYEPTK